MVSSIDDEAVTAVLHYMDSSLVSQSVTLKDFSVSSVISCTTSSLKAVYFARQASIFRVQFDQSQFCMGQVDIILTKLQPFTCLSLNPTDSHLAAACKDGTILIYDVKSQLLLCELSGHGDGSCTAFRYSPNGVDAVSSTDKGQLLVRVLRCPSDVLFFVLC
jgi:WD40 repeat protein